MSVYVGVNGTARTVKGQYVGVNGTARRVREQYVSVNGIARKVLIGDGRDWDSIYWYDGSLKYGRKYNLGSEFSSSKNLTLYNPQGVKFLAGDVIEVYFYGASQTTNIECDILFYFSEPDFLRMWGSCHSGDEEYHYANIQDKITNKYLIYESYKSGSDFYYSARFTLEDDIELPGTVNISVDRSTTYCELFVNGIQIF